MRMISSKQAVLLAGAVLALPAAASVSAQDMSRTGDTQINVYGEIPTDLSGMLAGPDVDGMISARRGNTLQITAEDGMQTEVRLSAATDIKARGGFLGLGHKELAENALLNGLPVEVETVQYGGGLIASEVRFSANDLEVANMIRGGTSQQFAAHGAAIEENAAATEALRGRVANIDQYNLKGTTNVYFDTGKYNLTPAAQAELCSAASTAEGMDNALILVVGYTDSTGSQEFNQVLSERRAGRVTNFLQQECGWKPWRMLTPTGMAEADPAADNTTAAGKAQNRRVSVNVLVSKAVDEG